MIPDTSLDRLITEQAPWVEWTHEPTGIACRIRTNIVGVWCGYAEVAQDHPLHGLTGMDEPVWDVPVHFGVAYGGELDTPGRWWLGWDAGHFSDYLDFAPELMAKLDRIGGGPKQKVWGESDAKAETEKLATGIYNYGK